jgi:hypothetical protein
VVHISSTVHPPESPPRLSWRRRVPARIPSGRRRRGLPGQHPSRPAAAAHSTACLRGQGQYRRRGRAHHRRLPRLQPTRRTSHAAVVQKLLDAGAQLLGKTNLDQFACGLNGTRSPYGAVPNAINPALYIRRVQLRLGLCGGDRAGGLCAGHRHGRLRARAGRPEQHRRPEALQRPDQRARRGARRAERRLRVHLRAHRGHGRARARSGDGLRRAGPVFAQAGDGRLGLAGRFPFWCALHAELLRRRAGASRLLARP